MIYLLYYKIKGGDQNYSIRRTKKATAKYEKQKYDKVLVRFPKGTKERIQEKNKSVNGFIVDAVIKELEK